MKKLIISRIWIVYLLTMLVVSLQSCKKSDGPAKSPTEYLTQADWKIKSVEVLNSSGAWVLIAPDNLSNETIFFNADGTCNVNPVANTYGSYKWVVSSTQLSVGTTIYAVTFLNSSMLQLIYNQTVTVTLSGVAYQYSQTRFTFSH